MRAILVRLPFMAMVSFQTAQASDVDYKLTIKEVSEFDVPKLSEPFSIAVKDRVWVAKGVEERADDTTATLSWNGASTRLRIEPSPEMVNVSYLIDFSGPAVQAPEWIDDALWPRTKELLRYGNVPRATLVQPEVTWAGLQR